MSFYTKYRPASFDDVLGNEASVEALRAAASKPSKDRPHAYLLHGPSGCGKTTLGRLMSIALGCTEQDYVELDSADFRGIETIRGVRRQSAFTPMAGGCRVWLLDEAHALTNDAQNALLKVLEEPPDHAYFILCTTVPQKLLDTVRSRCSCHSVSALNDEQMRRLLRRVVKAEEASLEKPIYELITRESLGRPRAALTILEQVLAVTPEQRAAVANKAATEQVQGLELCRALANGGSWKKVRHILSGLKDEDPESLRQQVLGYCSTVLLGADQHHQAAAVVEAFLDPFYDAGKAKLVYACYSVCTAEV